jgi:hypothetical protein
MNHQTANDVKQADRVLSPLFQVTGFVIAVVGSAFFNFLAGVVVVEIGDTSGDSISWVIAMVLVILINIAGMIVLGRQRWYGPALGILPGLLLAFWWWATALVGRM